MPVLLAFAFGAGVLTILAPCTLPMVPLVLGAGAGGGRRRAIGIVVGFGAAFVLLSVLLASTLVAAGVPTGQLRVVSAVALGLFGAWLALPALGERLGKPRSQRSAGSARPAPPGRAGCSGGWRRALSLGVVWAPCVGPIMASAIVVAATSGPTPASLAIALAYVAGAAVPLLAVAMLGRRRRPRRRSPAGPGAGPARVRRADARRERGRRGRI